jgi:hypothetical protein
VLEGFEVIKLNVFQSVSPMFDQASLLPSGAFMGNEAEVSDHGFLVDPQQDGGPPLGNGGGHETVKRLDDAPSFLPVPGCSGAL